MTAKNPLNFAQSLFAEASKRRLEGQADSHNPLNARDLQTALNTAADPGQDRLGLINRFRARSHESQEKLKTSMEVITQREAEIRGLAVETMKAQVMLMRAQLKHRFDTEFAVVAEKGLASFAQAQRSFYAIVDAACDQVHDDLYHRVNDIEARYQSGRLSDVAYRNEMIRTQRQADTQTNNLEACCQQRIDALHQAFNH